LAKLWGIDAAKVLGWIASGQLNAINISAGTERPRYLIDRADIQAFEQARATVVPPPKPAPRRRRSAAGVKEYF
jgi:hypothetical protein